MFREQENSLFQMEYSINCFSFKVKGFQYANTIIYIDYILKYCGSMDYSGKISGSMCVDTETFRIFDGNPSAENDIEKNENIVTITRGEPNSADEIKMKFSPGCFDVIKKIRNSIKEMKELNIGNSKIVEILEQEYDIEDPFAEEVHF